MKAVCLTLLLIFTHVSFWAQEFKLGNVSIAELEEKFHPADTSAAAAILFKRGKTYFDVGIYGWLMTTEVECRIKIYKKEGYEQATQELTYAAGRMGVSFSDACTYNLVNGQIDTTKADADAEFREDVGRGYVKKKITLPSVREGSVIEFRYKVITRHISIINDWYFEYTIPINSIEYEVAIPLCFVYNIYTTGYIDIASTTPFNRVGSSEHFQESVVTYSAKNVKAFREEPYVNNLRNYLSAIKFELSAAQFTKGLEKYSTDWITLAKRIYDDEDFGDELDYKSYFKKDLKLFVDKSASVKEKVDKVFSFVQERMAWNDGVTYYCRKGVKKAYEDQTGNSAEINLILTAMLREAGLNANPVLVSTRSNGIALYPSFDAYDYVIAGVETHEGIILLDATSKYTVPNTLPIRALNWQGRMIKSDGSSREVDLMPVKTSKIVTNLAVDLDAEGVVSGKIRKQYLDYKAYDHREKYAEITSDEFVEQIQDHYDGIEIDGYTIEGAKNLAEPIIEEYNFMHRGICDVIAAKMYFSPMLFFSERENPFKSETRAFPVDFVYPYQERYLIDIKLPPGYVIESMPESATFEMEKNISTFRYNIMEKGGNIQLAVFFDINYPIISQEYYKSLRELFQKVIEKENEKIVLKKA